MIYFDISYIVRLYFEDPGWEKVRALAREVPIACSLHGEAETVAAFHRKLRDRAVTQSEYAHVFDQFALDCREGAYRWLPLSPAIVERVKTTYKTLPRTVFVRSSDAIHLACASENRFREIYSNDGHLLTAASHFSIKGMDIIGG